MINNIWVELQKVRNLVKFLRKHKNLVVEESEETGLFCLVNKDGDVVYQPPSFDYERLMVYAVQCHKAGVEPNAIDLNNFDSID